MANQTKKYGFTGNKTVYETIDGKKMVVHEIYALKDIETADGNVVVKKGDVGGYVYKPVNQLNSALSQTGNCWVGVGSIVANSGYVTDNALIEHSIVEKATVRRDAIVRDSVIEGVTLNGEKIAKLQNIGVVVEGCVDGSHINGKVRENAVVKDSRILAGAKVGKNDVENEGVSIFSSIIKGKETYITGNSTIISSTIETNYKLVDSKLENVNLVDLKSKEKERTLEAKDFTFVSESDANSENA